MHGWLTPWLLCTATICDNNFCWLKLMEDPHQQYTNIVGQTGLFRSLALFTHKLIAVSQALFRRACALNNSVYIPTGATAEHISSCCFVLFTYHPQDWLQDPASDLQGLHTLALDWSQGTPKPPPTHEYCELLRTQAPPPGLKHSRWSQQLPISHDFQYQEAWQHMGKQHRPASKLD